MTVTVRPQEIGPTSSSSSSSSRPRIYRIEVYPNRDTRDPRGERIGRHLKAALNLDVTSVRSSHVYLLESPAELTESQLHAITEHILRDAVSQTARIGVEPVARGSQLIEVHPLTGVMDPAAQSVEQVIRDLLGISVTVRTGTRYDITGIDAGQALQAARQVLANPTIHAIHQEPFVPTEFPRGRDQHSVVNEIPITTLSETDLMHLSRQTHLFLSLEEMQAIAAHYKSLGREPRDIELETLAQTWSEHCVHKTLKSTISYNGPLPKPFHAASRPGHTLEPDGSTTIDNLLKSTIAAATYELIADGGIDWCLSVFVDNAGVIAFDQANAVCFKCETHNHPSAIEPYGGAATGIGGCIRDVIGTGLSAKPVAATDVFCVANPDMEDVPAGCLHPRRILTQVVAGVRDYGNRMGIPTLNGAVWFDDRYVGNPLVFCGCIGVMPADKIRGAAKQGDHIMILGGRTGRDGIHGATFSSAELTDTHAGEFGHAVQIGNAITEKRVLDAILLARDHEDGCLFNAITDCGAGGFSSAVGEMGEQLGATVWLDRAPLKYDGLTYTEIWISEAQERMVLAVPESNITELQHICKIENVEICDLGVFGTADRELILNFHNTEVGRLSMEFLHDGIPTPTRQARWNRPTHMVDAVSLERSLRHVLAEFKTGDLLLALLSHPNIASRRWIIRQYDHEVQGATVIKPLVGAEHEGPGDAAVITPILGSSRGLAIANGLATGWADDPYEMAQCAIDECVRNLVCVGADPTRIAILDNFCWPSCDSPENLGALVRAAEGCYDAAKAYRTPFISGKDSLNNQFTTEQGRTIEIPPTLLISGMGIVPDINRRCTTMDLKQPGNRLILVGAAQAALGGSHLAAIASDDPEEMDRWLPEVDLLKGPQTAQAVASLIAQGLVRSAHDCSEGGLLVALAEMAVAGNLGVDLDVSQAPVAEGQGEVSDLALCFGETPSRYVLEIEESRLAAVEQSLKSASIAFGVIGTVTDSDLFYEATTHTELRLDELKEAWTRPLDW